ncbi:uncharacterized protein LAJ45_11056 [Morchella importuna]|uniref:uncharacterized protein n=1 Tax=Morchella importuna TaxID=1174673 RepID=UPI001E8EC3E3|nr:uncharacterized protein LAJ45_11056 [Morchella importuna]KAH8144935.1 hypothetical protein LAJ45_11056 [Morchella importuna]
MADQAEITRHSHPLSRIVICCTSVPPDARQILAKKAQDMGARHVLDLTSDVTHLVCEDITTPKYRYVARMRTDVKVMMVGWVDSMYDVWIDGEDINPRDFEEKFQLPILYKLSISVTGILDLADRKKIEDLVSGHGASYHPDLTRHVTHLIAAAPTGKKYEFAMNNDISVVTVEWLHESLERGMALEESCYDPRLPKEKLGAGAKPAPRTTATAESLPEASSKRKIRKRAGDLLGSQISTFMGLIKNGLGLCIGTSRLFVVVPATMRKRDCPDFSSIEDVLIVTDWWLEACMHKSILLEPSDGFTYSPFEEFPLEGFKGMQICLTQFTGVELLHMRNLITLLGASFHDILTKKRNLLVTSLPARGDKFDFAIQNDIPVVTTEWLRQCLKECRAKAKKGQWWMVNFREITRDRGFWERIFGMRGSFWTSDPLPGDSGTIYTENQQIPCEDNGVLDKCFIYISKNLKTRSAELTSVARSLGAAIVDSIHPDTSITHMIHSSKTPRDTTKDFKVANATPGCHIVSPDWLYKCQESGKRVDEKAYPPIIAPSKGLEMGFSKGSSSSLSPVPSAEIHSPIKPAFEVKQDELVVDDTEDGQGFQDDFENLNEINHNIAKDPTPPTQLSTSFPVPQISALNIVTKPSSSDNQDTPDPASGKSSGGISDILGKLGKGEITNAIERKRPRGKLQGRATSNLSFYNNPSRASSVESHAEPVVSEDKNTLVNNLHDLSSTRRSTDQMIPAPSQAIRYEDLEAEKERKNVRAKLSGDAVGPDTPKNQRSVMKRVKTAVDVEGSVRRGRRVR